MKINYWVCPYQDFEDAYDLDDRRYWCKHPDRTTASCELNNKYSGSEDDCKLLDKPQDG